MTRMSQKTLDQLVTQDLKDLEKEITKVLPDMKAKNKKELEHLEKLYPLFNIEHQWSERGDISLILNLHHNSSLHTNITSGKCITSSQELDHMHLVLSLEKNLCLFILTYKLEYIQVEIQLMLPVGYYVMVQDMRRLVILTY